MTILIDPKKLVKLDVAYAFDNVDPPWTGVKQVVFLAIQAMARIVIWTKQPKEFYDDEPFFFIMI